jgi:hypothetical protein
MKNLSDHADLPCDSLTSLLIRGIQMGEMSKLGWLIGLVKLAIWAKIGNIRNWPIWHV